MQIIIEEPLKDIEFAQEWVKFKDDPKDGVWFLIAAWNRPSFQRAMELSNGSTMLEMKGAKIITDESAVESLVEFSRILGCYLILDFKGMTDKNKQPLKFDQNFAALLTTRSNIAAELTDFILLHSRRIQEEASKALDDIVGKSSNSTNTQSTKAPRKRKSTAKNKPPSPKP